MQPADILLVEDNEDDVLLTLAALKRTGFASGLAVCRDGAEALEFLFGEGMDAARPPGRQPKVILLDLKLPKIDGIEVARRVKSDPRTRGIWVVMLTSSSRQTDIAAAHAAGADHYLIKAVEFARFVEDIGAVGRQFLGRA